MNSSQAREPKPVPDAYYTLRLAGHLDQHWSAWFDGLTLNQHHDGTTTLDGSVPDQAALHGLLIKVRDLGVRLLSVQAVVHAPRSEHLAAGDNSLERDSNAGVFVPETATFVDRTPAKRQRRTETQQ